MYIDLHAHSRKHNVFIYGCESRKNSDKRLQEQVFPLMLHKNAADKVKIGINQNAGKFSKLRSIFSWLYFFSSLSKTASSGFREAKKELDV